MKNTIEDLAIFGGPRLFSKSKPIGQLFSPDADSYLSQLKKAFNARHLTNDGEIVRTLENELAAFHEVEHCIALANAGLGIIMLIQLFSEGRSGEVIMPAFSYRGLPHFAQWAGQTPRFADVDPLTHGLAPNSVAAAISDRTTAVLGVCNFNHPGNIDQLSQVARDKNVPFFLDSVYAVGSTYKGKILGSFAEAEVYSLHATKLLNGFEGGYITTSNAQIAALLKWQRNFALPALRPNCPGTGTVIGLNAKLNELHAALALLSIRQINQIIEENHKKFKTYTSGLKNIKTLSLIPYAEGERANYQMAVIELLDDWPLTQKQTVAVLRSEGAAITSYYSPPLHLSEHCPQFLEKPSLPVAEALARKFVQLPVGELTGQEDIRSVCGFLSYLDEYGEEISRRLFQQGVL